MGNFFVSVVFILVAVTSIWTQSGGPVEIKPAVIAGGGGNSSVGGQSLSGTIGQSVTSTSAVPPVNVNTGFWQSQLAPTAALATITGRVTDSSGIGIHRVRLVLTDPNGNILRSRSNPFGYFTFEDLQVGRTYVLTLLHRTLIFTPIVVTINDSVVDLAISPNKV